MRSEINIDEKNKKMLEATELLKKVSHPTRLAILCTIEKKPLCVGDIVEKLSHISQPMISQHLAVLKANRILADRKEGQFVFYHISDERILRLIQSMRDIFC
ncbi:MAG: ArsR/SmtB family transcription factor [Fusobacteriaceae bacterium]